MAVCCYLLFAKSLPFSVYDRALAPQEIAQSSEIAFFVPIALDKAFPLMIAADGPAGPTASNLRLFENGKPLQPHSPHVDIRNVGKGRFSHWGSNHSSTLLFAASDNTDPRSNGRTYTIQASPEIPTGLLIYFTLPLAVLLIQRWLPNKWLALSIAGATVMVCCCWLFVNGRFILLAPDSFAYVQWSELVPLGYPIFLATLPTLAWAPAVQFVLLSLACLSVCLAVLRVSKAAGVGASVLLLAMTPAFYNQNSLTSESLFVPAILANVASAIALLIERRRVYAVIAAGTAALIMFVRPAGYFAVAGILFLTVYPSLIRNGWSLRWIAVPFFIALFCCGSINYVVRGTNSQSQVGRILFPQIAYIFKPAYAGTDDRTIAAEIDSAIKPYRDAYQRSSSMDERRRYFLDNFNWLLTYADQASYKRFSEIDRAANGTTDPATYFARLDPLYVRLFLRTIAADPLGFLGIIRDQIIGGWRDNVMYYRGDLLSTYLADAKGNINLEERIATESVRIAGASLTPDVSRLESWSGYVVAFFEKIYRRLSVERMLLYFVGLASLVAIPISLIRPCPHIAALAYCGVILHGSLFLTATVTVLIPRYAMPTDPILALAGVILLDGLAKSVAVKEISRRWSNARKETT
jgi:hypothetical protein